MLKKYEKKDLAIKCPHCGKINENYSTSTCNECGKTLVDYGYESYVYANMFVAPFKGKFGLPNNLNIKDLEYNILNFNDDFYNNFYKEVETLKVEYNDNFIEIDSLTRKYVLAFYNIIDSIDILCLNFHNSILQNYIETKKFPSNDFFEQIKNNYFRFYVELFKFLGENFDLKLQYLSDIPNDLINIFQEDFVDNMKILISKLGNQNKNSYYVYNQNIEKMKAKAYAREGGIAYAANSLFEIKLGTLFNIGEIDNESKKLYNQYKSIVDVNLRRTLEDAFQNFRLCLIELLGIMLLSTLDNNDKKAHTEKSKIIKELGILECNIAKGINNYNFINSPYLRHLYNNEISISTNNRESLAKLVDYFEFFPKIFSDIYVKVKEDLIQTFKNKSELNINIYYSKLSFIAQLKNVDVKKIFEYILSDFINDNIEEIKNSNFMLKKIKKADLKSFINKSNDFVSKDFLDNQIKYIDKEI